MTYFPNQQPWNIPNQQPWNIPNRQPWNIPNPPNVPVTPHWPSVNITYRPAPALGVAFKPVRAGTSKSHIIYILDDSGSMAPVKEITLSAYNESITNQKLNAAETGIETFVSLFKFDGSNVICLFYRKNVKDLNPLTTADYDPRGMTNLYDAIGGVMTEVNNKQASFPESERDSLIISILTDGEENSSHIFDSVAIRQMVSKAEDANWGFQFLGANINAFAVGNKLGFRYENTLQFSASNIGATMQAATRSMNIMKSAYSAGATTATAYDASTFTETERKGVL